MPNQHYLTPLSLFHRPYLFLSPRPALAQTTHKIHLFSSSLSWIMNTKILLLATAFFALSAQAAHYVDPAQVRYDESRDKIYQKAFDNCSPKSFKTVRDLEKCRRQYFDEANEKFPVRGTDEYSEKFYSKLTKEQAEQKLIELEKIYNQAGMSSRKPGEISRTEVETEGWWIQKHIFNASFTQTSPFFIECKKQPYKSTVDHCPLGSGGK